MPWADTMSQKLHFISALESGAYTMSELCAAYGVSRQTGYKWKRRYESEGIEGLADRSRAPSSCPHETPEEVRELLLAAKLKHPHWGATKVLKWLERRLPNRSFPAMSTVNELFRKNGLVQKRRRRVRHKHPGCGSLKTTKPNDVWTADFKGQFKMLNGKYCYPLTIADQHTRYLLACEGLSTTRNTGVFPVFQRLFEEHGLPRVIHTDNGVPFATTAVHGLSELNVWWIRLGIEHSRTEPASPQQNAAHERMHRTLKRDTTRPPERNLKAQQERFDAWRAEYNDERPHEHLDHDAPGDHWEPSPRAMPKKLPEPEYPEHYEKRLVSNAGTFRVRNKQVFIGKLLAKDYLGLEEVEDGLWSVFFYDVLLARVDEEDGRLLT